MTVSKVLLALFFVLAVSRAQIVGSSGAQIVGSSGTASLLHPAPKFALPQVNQGSTDQTCCDDKTIKVYGSAKIELPPDSAILRMQVTVGDITLLSARVNSVTSVLNNNGLNSSNILTSSLSVYPNISWVNGVSTVVGQIATQSFTVTLPIINSDTARLGRLIDAFAAINGIILNGVSFDVTNKADGLASARGRAFGDAQKKASDYAASLQLSLGQVVQIDDSYSVAPSVQRVQQPNLLGMSNSIAAPTPTTINAGTISISYNVEAVYSYS